MPEIIRVVLHGQPVDADTDVFRVFPGEAGFFQDPFGNEVLAGAVGFDDGFNQVFGNILVVCKQLLGVLGEAVAAVAEGGVIVMGADARIQAHALDDFLGIQMLQLGIGVQLVEIADPQGKVGVGKQLHGLRLGGVHVKNVHILFQSALTEHSRKGFRCLYKALVFHVGAHNDPAGIQIVVQRPAFPEKLRAEQDAAAVQFFTQRFCIAHRYGGFDDYDGIGVHRHHLADHAFHRRGIKEVLLAVIVGGGGDHHELCLPVGKVRVQGCGQIQVMPGKIRFNFLIRDRRLTAVDHFHFFRHNIHRVNFLMLGKKNGNGKTHIACARNGNRNFFHG